MEKLLTTDETAELLQKPPGTLVNWRYRGVGPPYVQVMGAVRYRVRDLEKWLESNTISSYKPS